MGLDPDPARRPSIVLHFRGQMPDEFHTEGEIRYGTNGARRLVMSVQEGRANHKTGLYFVLTATGGLMWAAHGFADLPADYSASLRATETLFTPLALLSLLDARDVTLKELDEIKIGRRPARRIRVTIKEEIAHLDFDKKTGLLVRAVAKFDRQAELASSFRDYGDFTQDADQRALKAAGIPEAGFVTFLRQRARDPNALEKAVALLPELGDEDYFKRERAASGLIDLGASVITVVRLGLRDRDPEVVRQARQILDVLEKRNDPALLRAAIRQTVYYRPKRGVPALLALVPSATPDELLEIRAALFALAETDGQLEPTLVRALDDPDPKIRAIAEAIHGKDRETQAKQPGRRIFPRDVRLPARVRVSVDPVHALDFEVVQVEFFNSFDPAIFKKL
jgi:hypothetical protein